MLPEFSNAVFSLKRGAIAHSPVRTDVLVGMSYIYPGSKNLLERLNSDEVKQSSIQTLNFAQIFAILHFAQQHGSQIVHDHKGASKNFPVFTKIRGNKQLYREA